MIYFQLLLNELEFLVVRHLKADCAHAMQHAPLHARVKKKHCQKHSMEYKICPRSIKFVRGAMGQNRLNGANIYHVL